MGLTNYKRTEIIDSIESDISGTGAFTTVSQNLRVRTFEDLLKEVPLGNMPACYVIEPAGTVATTKTASQAGFQAAHNEFVTDLTVALIGISPLDLSAGETGHGVVVPLLKQVYDALLANRTRGGDALDTIPQADGHTAQTLGDRVAWVATLLCPFYWIRE